MTRIAQPGEVCRSAARLIEKAEAAGWETRATYSPEHDSLGVRLAQHDLRTYGCAMWVRGRFDMGYRWAPIWSIYLERVGYRVLSTWVASAPQPSEKVA